MHKVENVILKSHENERDNAGKETNIGGERWVR